MTMDLEDRLHRGLFQRIRRGISPYLLSASLGILGYACGNGSEPSQPQGCVTDRDCPSGFICQQNQCIPSVPSADSSYQPRPPEETWTGMKAALQSNNLDNVLRYFSPHVWDSYRQILSERNLPALADQLPDLAPSQRDQAATSGNFIQYEVPINGENYAITFNCAHGYCKIMAF